MSAHQPTILGISMTYNNNNSLLDSGLRGSGFQPWLWSLYCSLRQDTLLQGQSLMHKIPQGHTIFTECVW